VVDPTEKPAGCMGERVASFTLTNDDVGVSDSARGNEDC